MTPRSLAARLAIGWIRVVRMGPTKSGKWITVYELTTIGKERCR